MSTRGIAVAAVAVLLAACAKSETPTGDATDTRVVQVTMDEFRFDPDTIEVAAGTTVEFVVTNDGDGPHEAVIGDEEVQRAHEQAAEDAGGHGGHGDLPGEALELEPGATGELTYTFDDAGTVYIGCHIAGHYQQGMRAEVRVNAA